MEDRYHASLSLFSCKGFYGLPCRSEQNVIDDLWLIKRQSVQGFRQSKHDMEVTDRQKFGGSRCYPFFPLLPLTFRTVAIAAAIVADLYMTALIAFIHMPAQGSSAAGFDRP